jgi:hypothetical protein
MLGAELALWALLVGVIGWCALVLWGLVDLCLREMRERSRERATPKY